MSAPGILEALKYLISDGDEAIDSFSTIGGSQRGYEIWDAAKEAAIKAIASHEAAVKNMPEPAAYAYHCKGRGNKCGYDRVSFNAPDGWELDNCDIRPLYYGKPNQSPG